MKTPSEKYAEFGAWLVKGSDGWLHMLELLTAEKHAIDALAMGQLKTAYARIGAVIANQQALSDEKG